LLEGLRLDAAAACREIEEFVLGEVRRLGKRGVVIGLSGGLDSTVCAYLCVRALGRRRVLALVLPERDSHPGNIRDAAEVARTLGLRVERVDLEPILARLGAYDFVSAQTAANRTIIETGIRWLRRLTRWPSAFGSGISLLYGERPNFWGRLARWLLWPYFGRLHAFVLDKVRLRMLVLYHYAALHDYLMIGTTDRSEWSIGFYDKYGDGANDLALLRHLYKTQVRELARYLGVQAHIVDKPSSGDLAAGLPNESVIGLSYEQLDAILCGLEQGLPDRAIAAGAGVPLAAIAAVREAMRIARLREAMPSHLTPQ
jgi:NAD+ synthase